MNDTLPINVAASNSANTSAPEPPAIPTQANARARAGRSDRRDSANATSPRINGSNGKGGAINTNPAPKHVTSEISPLTNANQASTSARRDCSCTFGGMGAGNWGMIARLPRRARYAAPDSTGVPRV